MSIPDLCEICEINSDDFLSKSCTIKKNCTIKKRLTGVGRGGRNSAGFWAKKDSIPPANVLVDVCVYIDCFDFLRHENILINISRICWSFTGL
jgi:hypothetical protein